MRISVTIPENSELESKLKLFNKHERSALVKMAITKWFSNEYFAIGSKTYDKNIQPSGEDKIHPPPNKLVQAMGDFSD